MLSLSPSFYLLILLLALLTPPPLLAGENCVPCTEFDLVNSGIRDGRIGRNDALREFKRLLPQLKNHYRAGGGRNFGRAEWRFPLEGYDLKSAGNSGRDYVASGYDFFAGNRHGGHPSLDFFIRDRNQDSLDDRSGQPVNVLSLGGGIVVAVANGWQRDSKLRGGKYVWVYDPENELLLYYAHNRDVLVKLGDILNPGGIIATVGRSGLNASKKRSPTHLHLTCLKLHDCYPKPENIYSYLQLIP